MQDYSFKGLRKFLDIITEAENPYANDPKQSAIFATLSPEDQAWATKGGGKPDLTDPYIAARAPNKFKAVTPATTAAVDPNDPTNPANAVNPPAAPTGSAALDPAKNPNAATNIPGGPETAVSNAPVMTNPSAPINRDNMPFGKAFADAKAKGEKQFTWKGKPYAVKQAQPVMTNPTQTVGQQPMKQQAATAAGTDPNAVNPQGMAFGGGGLEESASLPMLTAEPTIARIVSLANHGR